MDELDDVLPLPSASLQILIALADGERHGYAIMQDVFGRSGGKLRLGPGTLYGSIKKLLEQGLLEEARRRPPASEDDERRRYYPLTRLGRRAAQAERAKMSELLKQARSLGLVPQQG